MSTHRHGNRYLELPSAKSSVELRAEGIRPITLELSPGHKALLNFDFLNERPQMQQVFFEYFGLTGESVAPITKLGVYRAIQQFIYFLEDFEKKNGTGYSTTADLDRGILLNFKVWLQTRPLMKRRVNKTAKQKGRRAENNLSAVTASITYNALTGCLNRLRRYRLEWFPLIFTALPRARVTPAWNRSFADVLSIGDLKNIVKVATAEIGRVQQQYKEIQAVLRKTEHLPIVPFTVTRPPGYWRRKENGVHSVIREQGVMGRVSPKLKQGLDRQGTYLTEVLGAYVPIGESALLPFALQLSVQTGLNVTSLASLTRDCIQDFSLPQYKKLLYDKPRSGAQRWKSQLIPSSGAKSTNGDRNGPLELIQFLKRWTEPLVESAPDQLKNHLFLFRAGHGGNGEQRIKAVSKYEAFNYSLEIFLNEHPALPRFSLSDLRPAIATYLYLTTHDVSRVKRFLGHRSIRTTILYIRGRVLAAEHDTAMSNGIQEMINRLLPKPATINKTGRTRALPILATVVEAERAFGTGVSNQGHQLKRADVELLEQSGVMTLVARCRRPDKPPAFLKVPAGQLCTRIFKCLNCPNATVLEEDLPTVLVRLKAMWAERERLSPEGWQVLYGEAWAALNQVVRLFSNAAKERAEKYLQQTLSVV